MSDEAAPTGGKFRLWPRTFWMRVLLIVVLLVVFFGLLPALFMTDSSSGGLGTDVAGAAAKVKPVTNPAKITPNMTNAQIAATLARPMTPAVGNAMLRLATIEDTISTDALFTPYALVKKGCHGRVWKVTSIKIRLIHFRLAWRRTSVDRWCWNSKTIIGSEGDGDDGSDAFFGYCWVNESHKNTAWNASGSERRVNNRGVLKTCARASLQVTANPKIFFKIGGKAHGG